MKTLIWPWLHHLAVAFRLVPGPSGEVENFDFGKDVLMAYRTVIGCCEGDSNPKIFIPRLVQLYKEGRFPIDKIIT